MQQSSKIILGACADPEKYVQGGLNLTTFYFIFFLYFFLVDEGKDDTKTTTV